MTKGLRTTTWREIRGSLGRYLAIAAIIALGVGFFAGLRSTTTDMIATTDDYLAELKMFDYRFASNMGYTEEELAMLRENPLVKAADGEISKDVIYYNEWSEADRVLRIHSLTEGVNELSLYAGRLPESSDEIVLDQRCFGSDWIGKTITVSERNSEETIASLKHKEYTVVGSVNSPLYLNYERGSTALMDGDVSGFAYILRDGFSTDVYTSLYAVTGSGEAIYSDEYKAMQERTTPEMEKLADELLSARFESIKKSISMPDIAAYLQSADPADIEAMLGFEPVGYVLDRDTNIGYVCFDNDARIVAGVARVFPAFFVLVAALVCMTTMSRMIEEQRTQIGVMKALGYTGYAISMKYLIYSGSAAVIGSVAGYFVGCRAIPSIIWKVYDIMYGFRDKLVFVWNPGQFTACLIVAILCPVGVTVASIAGAMKEAPAELIRPKAPKSGKRILFEKISFLWNRLSFLAKVSVRNVVRYRRRFFMMVIGIAGCMALLLAGHGIRDSITTITSVQYGEIEHYDYTIHFADGQREVFEQETKDLFSESTYISTMAVTLLSEEKSKDIYLYIPEDEDAFLSMVTIRDDSSEEKLPMPAAGECYINGKYADQIGVKPGDTVTLRREGFPDVKVRVAAATLYYVGNAMYMTKETFHELTGEDAAFSDCLAVAKDGADKGETAAVLKNLSSVVSVSVIAEFEDRIASMLSSLDLIVWLVIVCAAALAFIVLYNLTNITITERLREIATIKVLGFRSMETAIYVFRENLLLTAIGAVVGIPLGRLLLWFVMSQIQVDMVAFRVSVGWKSYVFSFLYTFLFAFFVDIVMYRRLERIDMAESLKSIE